MTTTNTAKTAVTAASRRLLKITRWVSATLEAGMAPVEINSDKWLACAQKPMRGSGSKIFWQLAVMVTATNQARGASVTQTYLNLPILIRMVVHTQKAMAASN